MTKCSSSFWEPVVATTTLVGFATFLLVYVHPQAPQAVYPLLIPLTLLLLLTIATLWNAFRLHVRGNERVT